MVSGCQSSETMVAVGHDAPCPVGLLRIGLEGIALTATEQLEDRQARGFAVYVPECDVQGAEAAHGPAPAVGMEHGFVEPVPDRLRMDQFGADEILAKEGIRALQGAAGDPRRDPEQLRQAGEAFVGRDLEQRQGLDTAPVGINPPAIADHDDLAGGNLHDAVAPPDSASKTASPGWNPRRTRSSTASMPDDPVRCSLKLIAAPPGSLAV